MLSESTLHASPEDTARRLTGLYVRCTLWYLLALVVLWQLGIEAIYGHVTPFYCRWLPRFTSFFIPAALLAVLWCGYLVVKHVLSTRNSAIAGAQPLDWAMPLGLLGLALLLDHYLLKTPFAEAFGPGWAAVSHDLPVLAIGATWLVAMFVVLGQLRWNDEEPSHKATLWLLAALVVFLFVFSAALAMTRGGLDGIAQAYSRHEYEYIDDIGRGRSLRGLFANYVKMHPYLSMHSKVHPPGPVALLWVLSFVVGRSPLGLSIATMVGGSLAVVPLYFWVKDMADKRVALTCCALYTLMPSIALFTATSIDTLFMPFNLTALFLFWRALHRRSIPYALAAGVLYGVCSVLSFSLIALGAFFAFIGLWRLAEKGRRVAVIQTAAMMLVAFAGFHLAIRLWSGFDMIECFRVCKAQFDTDQVHLDKLTPRFPSWAWRLLNPACWFFFAGVPVSVLFLTRVFRPAKDSRGLSIAFALTALVLSALYLGRGEGERSAMYVLPFLAVPAAYQLNRLGASARSRGPLIATCAFLTVQCWLIESCLFTYW